MILITITALSTAAYLFILFLALFAKVNNKTVKFARVLSLPVMVFPLTLVLLAAAWMLVLDFIHRGMLALKK